MAAVKSGGRDACLVRGRLTLNREGDRAFFEKKAGLTPYALDTSPLTGLFSLPDEDDDADEESAS